MGILLWIEEFFCGVWMNLLNPGAGAPGLEMLKIGGITFFLILVKKRNTFFLRDKMALGCIVPRNYTRSAVRQVSGDGERLPCADRVSKVDYIYGADETGNLIDGNQRQDSETREGEPHHPGEKPDTLWITSTTAGRSKQTKAPRQAPMRNTSAGQAEYFRKQGKPGRERTTPSTKSDTHPEHIQQQPGQKSIAVSITSYGADMVANDRK